MNSFAGCASGNYCSIDSTVPLNYLGGLWLQSRDDAKNNHLFLLVSNASKMAPGGPFWVNRVPSPTSFLREALLYSSWCSLDSCIGFCGSPRGISWVATDFKLLNFTPISLSIFTFTAASLIWFLSLPSTLKIPGELGRVQKHINANLLVEWNSNTASWRKNSSGNKTISSEFGLDKECVWKKHSWIVFLWDSCSVFSSKQQIEYNDCKFPDTWNVDAVLIVHAWPTSSKVKLFYKKL